MKKATKASDNRYYQARFSAAQKNTEFESREATWQCNTLCRRGCIYGKML